jgi:hypothetical protein
LVECEFACSSYFKQSSVPSGFLQEGMPGAETTVTAIN